MVMLPCSYFERHHVPISAWKRPTRVSGAIFVVLETSHIFHLLSVAFLPEVHVVAFSFSLLVFSLHVCQETIIHTINLLRRGDCLALSAPSVLSQAADLNWFSEDWEC